MSYQELFNIISTPWVSVKEIQAIAQCGRDAAIKIRNEIEKEIIKAGKKLYRGKTIVVPTQKVLEYLQLDIDFITEMAEREQKLNIGTKQYASISK